MKYLGIGSVFCDTEEIYHTPKDIGKDLGLNYIVWIFIPEKSTNLTVISICLNMADNGKLIWANFGFDNIKYSVKNGIPTSIQPESKLMLSDFINCIVPLTQDIELRSKPISKDQISKIAALINNQFDDRYDKYNPEYYVLEHIKNDYGEYEVKIEGKPFCDFKSGNSAKEVYDIIAGAFRNLINYIEKKISNS